MKYAWFQLNIYNDTCSKASHSLVSLIRSPNPGYFRWYSSDYNNSNIARPKVDK